MEENSAANPNSNPMLSEDGWTVIRDADPVFKDFVIEGHVIDLKKGQLRLGVSFQPLEGSDPVHFIHWSNIPFRIPLDPEHAALVAQRDRLRATVNNYILPLIPPLLDEGLDPDPNSIIGRYVALGLQPGDLGEGGA